MNVGTYAIEQGSLSAGGNYDLNFVGADLEITPATLTINAHNHDKVFGEDDPELTYSAGGFQYDDNLSILSGKLLRDPGEDVDLYDIHQGTLAANSNYAIDYLMAQLAVTQATPAIAVTGGTFVYNGQPHSATGSVTGVDDADLGQPTFIYSYTDANGDVVILSGAPVEPGVYQVEASYPGSQNYQAVSATTTITIVLEVHTLTDLSKIMKSGRTIPIKLQLIDTDGNNMSSSDIGIAALRLERIEDGTRTEVALHSAGNSNPDNLFRYDDKLGGYIFNLSTKGLSAGDYAFTWAADSVGDPIEHELLFKLR